MKLYVSLQRVVFVVLGFDNNYDDDDDDFDRILPNHSRSRIKKVSKRKKGESDSSSLSASSDCEHEGMKVSHLI